MSVFDPPSDPYGNEKTCWSCGKVLELSIWGEWICPNPACDTNEGVDWLEEDESDN